MATVNATRPRTRKASERLSPSDTKPPGLRAAPATDPRPAESKAGGSSAKRRAIVAHGDRTGVLSFRHQLADHERAVIDAALTILGGYLREPGAVFESPDEVKHYLRLHLAGERRELFGMLYLDAQHRAIAFETLFAGTLTQTSVYPREIVLAALRHDAVALVLVHNHPSGTVQPSRADEALTQTLRAALALVDVRVLDHVIVGGSQALSMAECGLFPFGPPPAVEPAAAAHRTRGRPRKEQVTQAA